MLRWLRRKSHTQVVIDLWRSPRSPALDYFAQAESEAWMRDFWMPGSRFRTQFEKLDLTAVLDLACGRGRHAAQFIDRAGHLTLLDTSPVALDACRERFAGRGNLTYLLSESGHDLRPIASSSLTAVLSYDAMVHFEKECVFGYVREIARVLRPGGRALIHHSVYAEHPGRDIRKNPDWRAFMPARELHRVVEDGGLAIESSETFPWTGKELTDGLMLLRKA
jgi:SAM-dependent methyltransferase